MPAAEKKAVRSLTHINGHISRYGTRCGFFGMASPIKGTDMNRTIDQDRNITVYSAVMAAAVQIGNGSPAQNNIGIALNVLSFGAATIYSVNLSYKISRGLKGVAAGVDAGVVAGGQLHPIQRHGPFQNTFIWDVEGVGCPLCAGNRDFFVLNTLECFDAVIPGQVSV